jgi:tetratricopeptide (TPR) repeat protein
LLPRGSQVSQASDLLTLQDFALPTLEQEFVRASIHRARLAERIKFAVTVLIGILALLTAIFAFRAQSARQESERSRSEAESLMTYMLGDFVEKLRPIGRLDLLDDVGNKALAYLGKTDATDTSSTSLVNRVKALRLIAEVQSNRGKVAESLHALNTARDLIKIGTSAFSNQPEFLLEAAKHANALGLIQHGNNELDKAEAFYKESRDYVDRVIKLKPDDTATLLEGAYAHTALGALAQRRSDYATAAQEFSQTVDLQRRAHSKSPNDKKIAAELATAISWQAESQLKLGSLSTAMGLYHEEEKILRSVNSGNANWTGKLALSLMRQALLYVAFADKESATRALADAERTMEGLVANDSSNVTWRARLLQAQGRLAEVQLDAKNAKQSYSRLQEICQKFAALADLDPKNTFLAYQSVKFELGRTAMLQMLGREQEALENTDAALIKLNSLRQKAPNDSILLSFLAEALISRADLSRRLFNDAAAIPYCQQANQILESAPGKENDFSLLAYDVRATLCMGRTTNIAPKIARLNEMGYHEIKFTQYISSHPLLKGKP